MRGNGKEKVLEERDREKEREMTRGWGGVGSRGGGDASKCFKLQR